MTLPDSLRCLRHRDLRLFFSGQTISLVGTWMQSVALSWLVYRLWHSSELLGVVGFLSQIPTFLLGAWAGSVADQLPRRKLVMATQLCAALQAGLLTVVTYSGHVQPWHVMVLSFLMGIINAFDIPSRQTYMVDMAGGDLENAIALNSSIVNGTRIVGPAIGGYMVASIGEPACFLFNALSYVPVIYALSLTRTAYPPTPGKSRGRLMEGVRYAVTTPHIRALLLLIGCASLFGMSYNVLMPVFAKDVFHGDATTQGQLLGGAGLGALIGAVSLLRRKGIQGMGRRVAVGASLFAAGLLALSLAPTEGLAIGALVVVGMGFMTQMAGTNTLIQGLSPSGMRGRLMGLYTMMFVGMAPFGALLMGEVTQLVGPRVAVASGGMILLFASAVFHLAVPRLREAVRLQREALERAPPGNLVGT